MTRKVAIVKVHGKENYYGDYTYETIPITEFEEVSDQDMCLLQTWVSRLDSGYRVIEQITPTVSPITSVIEAVKQARAKEEEQERKRAERAKKRKAVTAKEKIAKLKGQIKKLEKEVTVNESPSSLNGESN